MGASVFGANVFTSLSNATGRRAWQTPDFRGAQGEVAQPDTVDSSAARPISMFAPAK